MDKGKKTTTPGLYVRDDGSYVIVAVARAGEVKTEKAKHVPGMSMPQALVALESLRKASQREADAKARGEKTNTTCSAYARLWLEELGAQRAQGSITPRTVETHVRNLEKFILPFLGNREAEEVVAKDIKQWLTDVQLLRMPAERKGRGHTPYKQEPKPYAKATLANAWRTLRQFFGWLAVEADLAKNPAEHVRGKIEHAPAAKKRVWLTQSEAERLIQAAAQDRDRKALAMVWVALCGAMRPSELTGLDFEDVDLAQGAVEIRKSYTPGHLGKTKTRGSRRQVALLPEALHELRGYMAWRTENPQVKGGTILFPTAIGTRMQCAAVNDILDRCAKAAGIEKNVTAYALRRTTNNRIRQERGVVAAQLATGHVTQEMTAHYSEADHEEKLDALRAAFGPSRTSPTVN